MVLDARDQPAVAAYRAKHPLRGLGHGVMNPDDVEAGSADLDCEIAKSSDRATMDSSPYSLFYRRICEYQATEGDEDIPRFDEVILLDD